MIRPERHLPGCTPSHLIFLPRHSSQATEIFRRFTLSFVLVAWLFIVQHRAGSFELDVGKMPGVKHGFRLRPGCDPR